jgi:parallel beta-helix repeat protein
MAVGRRSILAIGVVVVLGAVVVLGRWYDAQRVKPTTADKTATLHVTNAGDRGPGTLREALFVLAGETLPTTILLEIPEIKIETALPALVNGRGVRLVGQNPSTRIDARALDEGPVFDVSGPNTSIEGVTLSNCPAAAILVRAVHFHLSGSTVESCDVGVDVAENASDTLLERNRFTKNRIGVRFGASGHNSVVASNEFRDDKDAGLWAVRGLRDSHDEAIGIRDDKFTEDTAGIVAGNVPVLIERTDFINSHESAVHVVGSGAVIRGNRINGGAAMGIVGENAAGAVIEDNEIEGTAAYGVMVRGSSDTLVRRNRLHNCGYGLAFVLGDAQRVSTAVGNTIIAAKFNGIDVIGDSPILRDNQVLQARAYGLRIEDFQPRLGPKVQSQPFLENNNFGASPVSRSTGSVAAQRNPASR